MRRVPHNRKLGSDSLVKEPDNSGSCSTEDGLTGAVRAITDLSLEDGNGAGSIQISEVVMLSESASDQKLINVPKEVLADWNMELGPRRTKILTD